MLPENQATALLFALGQNPASDTPRLGVISSAADTPHPRLLLPADFPALNNNQSEPTSNKAVRCTENHSRAARLSNTVVRLAE